MPTDTPKQLEWGEIHREMRRLFLQSEHWFIAFDSGTEKLIDCIRQTHYAGCGVEDFNMGAVSVPGGQVWILAIRKSRLPTSAYAALLKKAKVADLSPRVVKERDILVIAD